MPGTTETKTRGQAYGQGRRFKGLEAFAIGLRLKKARQLVSQLQATNPQEQITVLELGCGFWGSNLLQLSKEFPDVRFSGVDISVSSEKMPAELIAADLETWRPTQVYNGVLSLAVLEHLIDPLKHFELISTCLGSGGLCGLTSPTPPSHFVLSLLARLGIFDAAEIKDHKSYYTQGGIRHLSKSAGLSVEEYMQMSFGMNQWALLRKP